MKNNLIFLFVLTISVTLAGCADKNAQVMTEYKEIYLPVKCQIKLPQKPEFNPNNPKSLKETIGYYRHIETLLKGCASDWET